MHDPVYRELAPPADLAEVVRCFWMFRAALPAGVPPERIVPDGQPELLWHFGDADAVAVPGAIDGTAGIGAAPARSPCPLYAGPLYAGQLTRPLLLGLGANNDTFGVRLRAAGALRLGLPPQRALANERLELHELLPAPVRDAFAAVAEQGHSGDFHARVQLACAALRGALARTEQRRSFDVPLLIVADLAARIDTSLGRTTVRGLTQAAGWSERHLQREFGRVVGVTPKMYSRIVRFRATCRAMRVRLDGGETGRRWAAAATASGYFDQPHLVHDFREFSGLTPTEFLATLTPLNGAILSAD